MRGGPIWQVNDFIIQTAEINLKNENKETMFQDATELSSLHLYQHLKHFGEDLEEYLDQIRWGVEVE